MSWRPDWKNANAYPGPEKTSDLQWAWEFLRRWTYYQDFFEQWAIDLKDGDITEALDSEQLRELWDDFAILKLHDPAEEYSDEIGSHLLAMVVPEYSFYHPMADVYPEIHQAFSNSLSADKPGEIVFRIDANLPLAPQLEWVKKQSKLIKQYLARFPYESIAYKMKRCQPLGDNVSTDYGQYLRILDAINQTQHESPQPLSSRLVQSIGKEIEPEIFQRTVDKNHFFRTWKNRADRAFALTQGGYRVICSKALDGAPSICEESMAKLLKEKFRLHQKALPLSEQALSLESAVQLFRERLVRRDESVRLLYEQIQEWPDVLQEHQLQRETLRALSRGALVDRIECGGPGHPCYYVWLLELISREIEK